MALVLASPGGTGAARAAPAAPVAAHAWIHTPGAGFGSWTNVVVTASFPTASPTLRFSSVQDGRIAVTLRLAGIAEISPAGNFTALASFDPAHAAWALSVVPLGSTLDLQFTTVTTVYPAQGAWESGDDGANDSGAVGNASLRVDVYLNDSSGAPSNSTRVAVSVGAWPWLDANDSLGLEMSLLAGPATHIASAVGPSPNRLRELANGTGVSVADLTWASAAAVQYGNGSNASGVVATYSATAPDGVNSSVRLLFGQVPGNYSSLSYDPWIGLNLGAFPPLSPWALDLLGWGALAAGVAATIALGVVAYRRRRAPTDDDL